MKYVKSYFVLFLVLGIDFAIGQQKMDLYPTGIINVKTDVELGENVPEFYFYKPTVQRHDKVFLIIPGGGYARVAIKHEGHDVAKRLQDLGYPSFVLRYRLPVDSQMIDKRIAPIQDAQSALVYIRRHAAELGINAAQVGVLGFSAGGHLASTLSTHFKTSYIGAKNVNLRPDFSVLVYPVITMDDLNTHQGSKKNLIGPELDPSDILRFSNEKQVTESTPLTYLVHAEDDKVVPIENAYLYQRALEAFKVPNALYRYKEGGHGFGLVNAKESGDWFGAMLTWLEGQSLRTEVGNSKR